MTQPAPFNASGLRAVAAADAIVSAGPIRWATDERFWTYSDGVWQPGERQVHGRVVGLLGDRYRPAHGHAIRDVLRARVPELDVAPVPQLINFTNGLLDWKATHAPMLIGHDPAHLSTVQLPIRWAPGESRCDEFDTFLAGAVPIDDLQRVWEIIGYLMMSGNPLQRMFLLSGGGGNGKGVLLAVILALLGKRNVSSVALSDFVENQFAAADCFGRLANICGDIDVTYIERTGRIKALSGEDNVRGERKFGQPFDFEFWGKALFSANGIPQSADSSRGWMRRWEVVRFPFEPKRADRGLKARLTRPAVLEAIAVKAVLALRDLMHRGDFDHGESAKEAHREFAIRNNRVLAWIEEQGYRDDSARYPRSELYRAYRMWDDGENPSGRSMSSSTFYERLEQVPGLRASKYGGTRCFWGLRLNRDRHLVMSPEVAADPLGEPHGADTEVQTERLF